MTDPPGPDEIEVSLFGPGRGECAVCHLHDGRWMVVDSCLDPGSGEPVALGYLRRLNVDVSTQVVLVVVTHWHDDHIRGVSRVLESASEARFACSRKNDGSAFFKAIATGMESSLAESGFDELGGVMRILRERRAPRQRRESVGPVWASEGLCLYRDGSIEVTALSPSPATQALENHELRGFIASRGQPQRRAVAVSPNQRSVVVSIATGGASVLLGGDLEQSANPAVGWEAVVDSPVRHRELAYVFKVPHHGSQNADNPRVWSEMLSHSPVALLAPFSSGRRPLPSPVDIERLSKRTDQLYCTAPPRGWKPPRREPSVERMIRETVGKMRVVSREVGHLRARYSPSEPDSPPAVRFTHPALRL